MSNQLFIEKEKYWFSIFLALYPVLCIYKAFGNFTIGDVFLMCFFILKILHQRTITKFPRIYIYFGIYVMLISLFDLSTSFNHETTKQFTQILIREAKLLFYIICVVFVSNNYIDQRTLKKWLIIVGVITSLFMIFQNVMFFGNGKIILGQITGLTVYLEEYTQLDYENFYSFGFRPSSIFLEPAMVSQYIIVSLLFLLFTENNIKHKVLITILLTSAIILSTSAQGFVYLAVAFFFFILKMKRKSISAVIFGIFVLLIFIGYEYIEPLKYAIDRLLYGEEAAGARLDSYSYCFELSTLKMIFGNGYGCTPNNEYLAGAAYVWYGTGLVGLGLAIYLFMSMLSRHNSLVCNIIVFIFFFMFWSSSLFYNYMFFWFFSIILGTSKLQKKENA